MSIDYRKIIFTIIAISVLGTGGFFLYKYLTRPAEVTQPPIVPPSPTTEVPPTPIVSGSFKPVQLSCAKDNGVRLQELDFVNNPSAILLDDGRYRIYYDTVPYVVKSAVSSDGIFFTSEGIQKQGLPDTEETYVGSPSVIKADNKWMMYYQGSVMRPNASTKYKIFAGVSGSGLNFGGRGVVIDDQTSTFGAKNPEAVVLPGGKVRLYYLTSQGVKTALSDDGINFTPENGPIITGATGVSVINYLPEHYLALCAANPNLSKPELQTIRTLNAKNSVDFDPKACGQGSLALKPSIPFDFWGVQAPSIIRVRGAFRVFYQGFNVEPSLGGGSVILSATCSVEEI